MASQRPYPPSAPESAIRAHLAAHQHRRPPSLRALQGKFGGSFTRLGRIRRAFLEERGLAPPAPAQMPPPAAGTDVLDQLRRLTAALGEIPAHKDLRELHAALRREAAETERRHQQMLGETQDLVRSLAASMEEFVLATREAMRQRVAQIGDANSPRVIPREHDPWLALEERIVHRMAEMEARLAAAAPAPPAEEPAVEAQLEAHAEKLSRALDARLEQHQQQLGTELRGAIAEASAEQLGALGTLARAVAEGQQENRRGVHAAVARLLTERSADVDVNWEPLWAALAPVLQDLARRPDSILSAVAALRRQAARNQKLSLTSLQELTAEIRRRRRLAAKKRSSAAVKKKRRPKRAATKAPKLPSRRKPRAERLRAGKKSSARRPEKAKPKVTLQATRPRQRHAQGSQKRPALRKAAAVAPKRNAGRKRRSAGRR